MYSVDLTAWQHACWKALNFSMSKRHYYQYCYKSEGKGAAARYWIKG
ncbi:MAG: hypothetical protein H6728_16145 [Myxococcales bacterium]|nr:hypothetical protein [Myxococcales bacterium]